MIAGENEELQVWFVVSFGQMTPSVWTLHQFLPCYRKWDNCHEEGIKWSWRETKAKVLEFEGFIKTIDPWYLTHITKWKLISKIQRTYYHTWISFKWPTNLDELVGPIKQLTATDGYAILAKQVRTLCAGIYKKFSLN